MSTPDSALFSDLQVILRASRQQTSPESQVLANSIKSVRDSLFHNPVWQAITQGPFPSTLEGSHNEWAAVGVFIFATLALHIIEDPSHTPMTIGCRRRVLSNLPTTLTNPLGVFLARGGWLSILEEASTGYQEYTRQVQQTSPSADGLHPIQKILDSSELLNSSRKYLKILENFDRAASHLSWLRAASRSFLIMIVSFQLTTNPRAWANTLKKLKNMS
ncbi:hypothetical protein F5879DRAFT_993207 [Lentinula edodes]|nr:hypothetical protein F5879DRAFT_993207 [Lentinula edodes]